MLSRGGLDRAGYSSAGRRLWALCREVKQNTMCRSCFLTAMGENEDIVKGPDRRRRRLSDKSRMIWRVFMARDGRRRLRAAHPKERAVRLSLLQMNLLSGRAYIGGDRPEPDAEGSLRRCCIWRGTRTAASARKKLYEAVWQQPMGADPHAVRMTISRLKQKLGGEDARVTVNSVPQQRLSARGAIMVNIYSGRQR